MTKLNAFLIYKASARSVRVVMRYPNRLAWDEVAFKLQLTVPDPWGRLAGAVVIDLPDTGPAVIEVKTDPVVKT